MKITINALWLGASMALMAAMVTPTMADEWNKETVLEFSGPVEVPGKVLTPGKYVFKIADSESDRNIVQIFSDDTPSPMPAPSRDGQVFADRTMLETAGQSVLELIAGLALLSAGIAVVLASRHKAQV